MTRPMAPGDRALMLVTLAVLGWLFVFAAGRVFGGLPILILLGGAMTALVVAVWRTK